MTSLQLNSKDNKMISVQRRIQVALSFLALICCWCTSSLAFTAKPMQTTRHETTSALMAHFESNVSRRSLLQSIPLAAITSIEISSPVLAAENSKASSKSLESCLYTILRVKEATIQETRLITSGKFKDAARGNVKLAVKFMLNNYRLSDAVIAASAYIDDNNRRLAASDVGQAAVQNLYTILEYFDAQDVANIKVGQADSMASKEPLVLKGLDSTRKNIDDFLSYFPKSAVDEARDQVLKENELNKKEWDPALGDIFNLPSTTV